MEIEHLKAERHSLWPRPGRGGSLLPVLALGGPIRELERQLKESDQRLEALKRKQQEGSRTQLASTQTESLSLSVCDNEAEPIQETVRRPMVTDVPSGTTRIPGNVKKQDLSRYLDVANLTEKQYQCASLRWEYNLSMSEIARRLQKHRATVAQHIQSAQTKMRSAGLYEKVKKRLSRIQPEE